CSRAGYAPFLEGHAPLGRCYGRAVRSGANIYFRAIAKTVMRQYQPLNGIRVLDLSRVLAGPLCTMLLGDLGASVIKVERPGGGDETRTWGPPFDAEGHSAYFLSINRNKLSVAIDIDTPADRELLVGLISDADVVVDN